MYSFFEDSENGWLELQKVSAVALTSLHVLSPSCNAGDEVDLTGISSCSSDGLRLWLLSTLSRV